MPAWLRNAVHRLAAFLLAPAGTVDENADEAARAVDPTDLPPPWYLT